MNTKILFSALLFAMTVTLFSCKEKDIDEPKKTESTTVDIKFVFNGKYAGGTLEFNKDYITSAVDTIRFERIKYLLSNFALVDNDNKVIEMSNQYAYLSLGENIDTFTLRNVPKGNYKTIRMNVGLDSLVNFGDPAQYSLTHPLCPSLNNMHWGWSGGYIFNVVEGYFNNVGPKAFSFHIATLRNKRTYNFAQNLSVTKNGRMTFDINADKYFTNVINYSLIIDGSMSHSGNVDPIMDRFIQNAPGVIEFINYSEN